MVMGIQEDVFIASTARSDAAAAALEAAEHEAAERAAKERLASEEAAERNSRAGEPHWEPYAVVGFSAVLFAAYLVAKVRITRAERKTKVTH